MAIFYMKKKNSMKYSKKDHKYYYDTAGVWRSTDSGENPEKLHACAGHAGWKSVKAHFCVVVYELQEVSHNTEVTGSIPEACMSFNSCVFNQPDLELNSIPHRSTYCERLSPKHLRLLTLKTRSPNQIEKMILHKRGVPLTKPDKLWSLLSLSLSLRSNESLCRTQTLSAHRK